MPNHNATFGRNHMRSFLRKLATRSWWKRFWILSGMAILPLLYAGNLNFQKLRVMDPVPEESDHFLSNPMSADYAQNGRLYLLDSSARVIFWWDREGRFGGTIGRPGQGPGEFSFQTRSGPQGYLAVVGEEIHVFDAGQRVVQSFDLEGRYLRLLRLNQVNGRTEAFYVRGNNQFLVFNHNFMNPEPSYEVHLLGADGESAKTLFSVDEKDIGRPVIPPTADRIFIEAHFPAIVTAYDRSRDELILGDSGRAQFDIRPINSGTGTTLRFKHLPPEVSEQDKREFLSQDWLRRSSRFEVVFPESMTFYDRIHSLGERGFLLYNQSPVQGRVRGIWINRKGDTRGRFALTLGQNGAIFSSSGRLIRVQVHEDGVFEVAEVSIGAQPL